MNKDARNISEEIIANPKLREQLKSIVLERTNAMPDTLRMAIGSEEFEKKDLIEHIKNEDDIGKQMMTMELEFLRALTSGSVYTHE